VSITAEGPEYANVGTPFNVEVKVEAEAGTLAIAAQPLRAQVKLATRCGGSFAGTEGQTALDQQLPAPGSGPYSQTVTAKVTPSTTGKFVLCAFLDDAQERQFATDTEAEVNVAAAGAVPIAGTATQCTAAKRQLTLIKRKLKRLELRIKKVKRKLRHVHGRHHKALAHKLHTLKVHKRKALKRRKRLEHTVAGVCS